MKQLSYYLYKGALYDTETLQHWGVKGMKWGIRRYQNPDGSLTAAGRRRALKRNERDIQLAKNALKVVQREYEPAKKARDEAESKIYEYLDKIEDYDGPDPELDSLYENLHKAEAEYNRTSGNLSSVESYLKGLMGEPFNPSTSDFYFAAVGEKYVSKLILDDKYHSDFWDENGQIIRSK